MYAASHATFLQSCEELARKLKLPAHDDPRTDICELVSRWLSEEDASWLMVLDNADNSELIFPPAVSDVTQGQSPKYLINYVPSVLNSEKSLLVTTRSRIVGQRLALGEDCVEVAPLSGPEAEALLRSKLKESANTLKTASVERLIEVLGYIPLAITQAAAFVRRNRWSIEKYLAALESDKQNLMDHLSEELQDPRRPPGFPNSVFRTWKLSFDQIFKNEPKAADLLSLIAMLDPRQIPGSLLQHSIEREVDFRMAIGTLNGFALITIEVGGDTYAIHPLVQASVHYWLEQRNQKVVYAGRAVRLMAKQYPWDSDHSRRTCEIFLPHAQAALCYRDIARSDLSYRASLLSNIGQDEMIKGQLATAYENLEEAYDIRRNLEGKNAPATLNALIILASSVRHRGDYKTAEKMTRRVLKAFNKALEPAHPETLRAISDLAVILGDQGRYEEAEKLHREALKSKEDALGIEHVDTLQNYGSLAWVLNAQERYEEAEALSRRAMETGETVLGIKHKITLQSMSYLATALRGQGKYEEAGKLSRRVVEVREEVLGVEHPATMSSVCGLANTLRDQEQYDEAEKLYQRALEYNEKALGMRHPETFNSMWNLAVLCARQQLYDQASVLYDRAAEGLSTSLGPEHPHTRGCLEDYALMKRNMKDQGIGVTPSSSSSSRGQNISTALSPQPPARKGNSPAILRRIHDRVGRFKRFVS